MAYSPDICRLVIENAALVEEAQAVLTNVDGRLYENIWDFIKKLAAEQKYFDLTGSKDGNYFFSRQAWGKTEREEPIAAFWLDYQGDNSDRSWLSILAGIVPGTSAGLYFWYEWVQKGIRRREWKSFLKDFFISNPGLRDNGFVLNDEGTAITRPLRIDLQCLADNFQNPEVCFDAIGNALDAIYAERKSFETLVDMAGRM